VKDGPDRQASFTYPQCEVPGFREWWKHCRTAGGKLCGSPIADGIGVGTAESIQGGGTVLNAVSGAVLLVTFTMNAVHAEASNPIILADNLSKVYAAGRIMVAAVREVSFQVKPGEFVAIVGPSGSGKSTLFYLLGGLTSASEGRVLIDGIDFATLSDAERTRLRRQRIGFVFQKFNLLPTLSAMGNIEIAYKISSRKEPLDRQYLEHLSDLLSIRGRLEHRPSELSGGEQQRVAIARALITRPAIVLADEPTGNLDTKNSDAVLKMLVRSNRELGQTTLMITHNPEAAAIAGRILHMRDGEIIKVEAGAGHITDAAGCSQATGGGGVTAV
jgi:putative ABC transport system ATP-binding protein